MTKRNRFLTLLGILIVGALLIKLLKETTRPNMDIQKVHYERDKDTKDYKIDGKKVIGLTPGNEEKQLNQLTIKNKPTTEWQISLENQLKVQGGAALKDITLKKIDSFIWAQDGIAFHVESVLVKIKDQNNSETSFRVLVDSQTGKILMNWDQPIFDPANPRNNFKVKIDPRYHNN